LKDDKLLNILEQSVKRIKLDLSGLSLLLPESPNDPTILPLVAGLAGAENVYIMSKGVEVVNKIMRIAEGEGLETRYFFLEKETPEILSRMDILVKGKGMPSLLQVSFPN